MNFRSFSKGDFFLALLIFPAVELRCRGDSSVCSTGSLVAMKLESVL